MHCLRRENALLRASDATGHRDQRAGDGRGLLAQQEQDDPGKLLRLHPALELGVGHVTAVLAGQTTESVLKRGHEGLSTFGLLKESPIEDIRGFIDQLTHAGYLLRAGEPYPTVQLTAEGRELMRGSGTCVLHRQPRRPERRRAKGGSRPGRMVAAPGSADEALLAALRALRLSLARDPVTREVQSQRR